MSDEEYSFGDEAEENKQDHDEPAGSEELDELPQFIGDMVASARSVPRISEHLQTLVPMLAAAWRAGQSGVALSSAVRMRLDADKPLDWPDELAAEFTATLGEFADTIPGVDQALPIATDLMQVGDEHIDPAVARAIVIDVLTRLEAVAEKTMGRLLELAFSPPEASQQVARTQQWMQLFLRLEDLFDRALQTWLEQQHMEPNE